MNTQVENKTGRNPSPPGGSRRSSSGKRKKIPPSAPAHLLEADDVGVPQRAVVYDLPRHILVNLRSTENSDREFRGERRHAQPDETQAGPPAPAPHLEPPGDVLHGDELLGLPVPHEPSHPEVAGADVLEQLVLLHGSGELGSGEGRARALPGRVGLAMAREPRGRLWKVLAGVGKGGGGGGRGRGKSGGGGI